LNPGDFVKHAVAGGVGSILGGGKFMNGATTGAFGYLFNDMLTGTKTGNYGPNGPSGFPDSEEEALNRAANVALALGQFIPAGDVAADALLGPRIIESATGLGEAGESAVRAAYDIGLKQAIDVGGQARFPDGLTTSVVSEVKNVQSLSYTQQLQDLAKFAQQTGRRFDLYVRYNTRLSGPLQQAAQSGRVNLRFIPGQ
jgi:hypothetical protein